MINFRKILLLNAFFALSSCTGISKSQIKQVLNNEKALIFYSASLNITKEGLVDHPSSIILNKNEKEELKLLSNSLIEPGEYYLSGFGWSKIQSVLEPGISVTELIRRARRKDISFEYGTVHIDIPVNFWIKGGQVLYLGDITFNYNTGKMIYNAVDNFDKTYKEVSKKYPQLLGRLEKRLILRPTNIKK